MVRDCVCGAVRFVLHLQQSLCRISKGDVFPSPRGILWWGLFDKVPRGDHKELSWEL
jgi:hypothetical protein